MCISFPTLFRKLHFNVIADNNLELFLLCDIFKPHWHWINIVVIPVWRLQTKGIYVTEDFFFSIFPFRIYRNVQKFYCKVNSVSFDFKDIPSDVKSKLIDTYCLVLYGSQLWKYSKNDVNAFYIAWRKVVGQIWKISSTTHCNMLPSINKSLPIEYLMEKDALNLFGHVLIVIT